MGALYALNLQFDPSSETGQFQPYSSDDHTGRAWWKRADAGGTWSFVGNPDTWSPDLSLADGDQVQFAVSAAGGSAVTVQNVLLSVQFAVNRHRPNNPARVSSPFQIAGGAPRCLLQDVPSAFQNWHVIGPYGLAINTRHSGRGRLRFEFSVAARVTFADGTVKEYGYDPEMDVDV